MRALAAFNDPPGQIDFFTERRLANQLNISVKLLRSTIKKAVDNGKIDLYESQPQPNIEKKQNKNGSTRVKNGSKKHELVTSPSKTGIPRRTIFIRKWNDYQSGYLRQKPYRTNRLEEQEESEGVEQGLQNSGQKIVTRVTDRGEETRGEEIIVEKIRGEDRITASNSYDEFESDPPIQSNPIQSNPIQEFQRGGKNNPIPVLIPVT